MKSATRIFALMLTLVMLLSVSAWAAGKKSLSDYARPDADFAVPDELAMDWNGSTADEQVKHHRYAEYEAIMQALAAAYPESASLYSIGHTAMERELWCLEITNRKVDAEKKTGIGVFGNIHGGEMESAECAMYTGWWLLLNSDEDYVQTLLDNYIVYCVPMINPDGMEQSFVYNVRCNLSARDADGDGAPFSDPYTDVDGDGFIADVYLGESGLDTAAMKVGWRGIQTAEGVTLTSLGMESPDWNLDGVMGNDPRSSGIDLNRTFDYMYGRYDADTYNPYRVSYTGYESVPVIGNNAWSSNGQDMGPADELEAKAMENFLAKTPMNALVTLHTGIQTVLWPWCWQEADYENDEALAQMAAVGKAMAESFAETASSDGVTRNFYYRSSWSDYPTTSELIDYAYGRLGIHAYTIEVYSSGDSDPQSLSSDEMDGVYLNYDGTYSAGCTWQNGEQLASAAAPYVKEYSYEQVIGTGTGCLGFTQTQADALGLSEGMSLYFATGETAQMSGVCPTDMQLMVEGAKDAILTMIESEPYGDGWACPWYLR